MPMPDRQSASPSLAGMTLTWWSVSEIGEVDRDLTTR